MADIMNIDSRQWDVGFAFERNQNFDDGRGSQKFIG